MNTDDHDDIAEKIRGGEYFREARSSYASMYLDPIAERYYYLLICVLSSLTALFAIIAMISIFPLTRSVPFVYPDSDLLNDIPSIRPLAARGDDVNLALKRFLVGEYVMRRESYDINTLNLNVSAVKAQSAPEVYATFEKLLDPSNPESPIKLYERHTVRRVEIVSAQMQGSDSAEVVFDAILDNRAEQKKARFAATIAFRYRDVTIDQQEGTSPPLEFAVTQYSVRRL